MMRSRFSSMLLAACSAILPLVAEAQVVTNLHTFTAGGTNGDRPYAVMLRGSDGNLYGATKFGGSASVGAVFRISPNGAYTNIYSFASTFTFDGWQPIGGLVRGNDGNFYGTTSTKGTNSCSCGTVFRISPSGSNYTTIHYFTGGTNGGSTPSGALVLGNDGNFYGTALAGGGGPGVVFRISPTGQYTNIYAFGSIPSDGAQPSGGLVLGSDGNFYGTTFSGGSNGFGTVFRVSTNGSYAVLHRFRGGFYYGNDEGRSPYGTLVEGRDGNFYGTTAEGGTNLCACGVVYRISPGGSYTTLYSFRDSPDGANPHAGLVLGSDGNFYGTTSLGGVTNFAAFGTVFRITPGGQYVNLFSFGSPGSGGPEAAMVQGNDGNFYGTTALNGPSFRGTIFKLFASLPSPANQMRPISLLGTNVVVTVASIAGETYQLQYATDLTSSNWVNVAGASVTNSIGGPVTLTNVGGALSPVRFYRFGITP